jgi:CubicO group peptidase (beta-lactamase class C family)
MKKASYFCLSMIIVSLFGTSAFSAENARNLPSAEPEEVGMSSDRIERVKNVMKTFVDDGKVKGLLTAIVRDGKVVHFETYGMMDAEQAKPMKADTLFRMYSMTKVVTGVAVMMLYEEGHFTLNDPISKFLPEFENMTVYAGKDKTEPANKPITFRHLLTHTSGISYDFYEGTPIAELYKKNGLTIQAAYQNGTSLEDFTRVLAKQPLANQPGEAWHYGMSIDVLGRLIEVISGQDYGEFLDERVFKPLGMVDASFTVTDDKLDRFAANYMKLPTGKLMAIDPPDKSLYRQESPLEFGGAGLVCTAMDYLRMAQMLVNGGELDGVRLLSPKTVDLMTTNHLSSKLGEDPLGQLFAGGAFTGVGFGLTGSVVTSPAANGNTGSVGEFSWGGAASTDFWIDPTENLVGMVLTQLMPAGIEPTRTKMHQMTYQAITESYAD